MEKECYLWVITVGVTTPPPKPKGKPRWCKCSKCGAWHPLAP
jgi:hypothetical protein